MLKELNFVMNYVFTLETWYSFSSEDVKNPCHFECPHRLSDKLLKSSAASFSLRRGVHITLSRCRVKHLFLLFSARFSPEPR
ncbi:hypothetical protein EAO14_17405 [Klebsiella pneumoniae]|nr:hypothetical protein EAO14_17405 [Klebsiella pneumoniae]